MKINDARKAIKQIKTSIAELERIRDLSIKILNEYVQSSTSSCRSVAATWKEHMREVKKEGDAVIFNYLGTIPWGN